MLKVSHAKTMGWEGAFRGMRNPLNSWEKADSDFSELSLGKNDLSLAKRLIKAGTDHRKFLRMIHVQLDILAPLYWWKEFDTYKVGTTANSCSTMHKIHAKEFTIDDFSCDKLGSNSIRILLNTIEELNVRRRMFLAEKDTEDWYQMIQLLPSSYNQLRTVDLDYETLARMYFARKNHKLEEWHTLVDKFVDLPYFREFFLED